MVWGIAMLHGTVELILFLLQLNPKFLLFCTAFFFLTEVEMIFWIFADFLNCGFTKASKIWFSFLLLRMVISTAYIPSPPCSVRNICVLDDFIGSETIIRAFCLVWGFTSVLLASSSFLDLTCNFKIPCCTTMLAEVSARIWGGVRLQQCLPIPTAEAVQPTEPEQIWAFQGNTEGAQTQNKGLHSQCWCRGDQAWVGWVWPSLWGLQCFLFFLK